MNQLTETANGNTAIDESAELGFGTLLVAEDKEGGYEPVALVSTLREARELAAEDFRFRLADGREREFSSLPGPLRDLGAALRELQGSDCDRAGSSASLTSTHQLTSPPSNRRGGLLLFQQLRRSRKVIHFCSIKVTHLENRSRFRRASSSTPQACAVVAKIPASISSTPKARSARGEGE